MTNRKSEKINRQKCFSAKMKIGNFVKFGFVSILLFVWFGCCCRRDLFAVYTQKVRSKIVRVHAHCIHSFSQTFRKEFLHRRLLVNRNLYHFRLVRCIAHCVRLERILFVSSFCFGSSSSTFVFILSASSLPSSSPRMFAIMEFCRSFQFSFFLCFAKNKTSTSGRTETNKYQKPNDERREKKNKEMTADSNEHEFAFRLVTLATFVWVPSFVCRWMCKLCDANQIRHSLWIHSEMASSNVGIQNVANNSTEVSCDVAVLWEINCMMSWIENCGFGRSRILFHFRLPRTQAEAWNERRWILRRQ